MHQGMRAAESGVGAAKVAIAGSVKERVSAALAALDSTDTRAMIRCVATVLLDEFNETPSTKRIHELLGRASYSTITDELRVFWRTMRESAQAQLQLQSIPETVVVACRNALPALWEAALNEAGKNAGSEFQEARAAADRDVSVAQQERDAAVAASHADKEAARLADYEKNAVKSNNLTLQNQVQDLRDQLAAGTAQRNKLEESLQATQSQLQRVQGDLGKVRLQAESERTRSLLETDRLRQSIKQAEATLQEQVRERTAALEKSHAREVDSHARAMVEQASKHTHLQEMLRQQNEQIAELTAQIRSMRQSGSSDRIGNELKSLSAAIAGLKRKPMVTKKGAMQTKRSVVAARKST